MKLDALERVSLHLQPQLAHGGEHSFLADDDAIAPELAVDPAVPVAALVKTEPLGGEALQGLAARSARWISSSSRSRGIRIRARARSRMPSRWGRTRPYTLWGTRASRMVLAQEGPEIF